MKVQVFNARNNQTAWYCGDEQSYCWVTKPGDASELKAHEAFPLVAKLNQNKPQRAVIAHDDIFSVV